MDDQAYDLVLRDPEGGILMRWVIDAEGRPCLGNGKIVPNFALWNDIGLAVQKDRLESMK